MIDPSTPDITARVLEAFAAHGFSSGEPFVDNAIRYLLKTQERDGSWFGRWGINHIYGTWQVLTGLAAVGLEPGDRVIQRGAEWLIEHQSSEGGWGESPASYSDPGARGVGPMTPSQTSWAVLGLLAAGRGQDLAAQRGVEYLLAHQQPNGTWQEAEFTGTGFPLVFYLRYHMYPAYFPMLALAGWRNATGER
jgi:squalene-hopene/tetraprenyl-beta-curcumene cyclase